MSCSQPLVAVSGATKLSDFAQVTAAGKIRDAADEGDKSSISDCGEADDVLLTTANGQSSAFPSPRCGSSKAAIHGRAAALPSQRRSGDLACDFAHTEADSGERLAYLRMRRAGCRHVSPEPKHGDDWARRRGARGTRRGRT